MAERMVEIRGKRVTEEDIPELKGRIGPDEAAVVVTEEELLRQLAEQKEGER